ncbi:aspartate aminotransferase family protein [Inquilinus sp.]|jgi:4-aminobutyrate aminotransferase|uniref:(R)-1-hydroxy-2-aminoethylphosphonate ammonia-lyase n=1 Tax=Inquilinus sp. TaxID=1932117 RepID=UPI00378488A0
MTSIPQTRAEWYGRPLSDTARDLLDRDAAAFIRQDGSTPCLNAVAKAEGIWLEDVDGRRVMDFHGNSTHHIGYGHPRLKAALKDQIDDLPFTPRRYTSAPAIALAERLIALSPHRGNGKVLFATGGSDAIEIALKLARVKTGRYKTLAFFDSYHGHGYGAVSAGGSGTDRTQRIGPLLPGGLLVPPFNCTACAYGFERPAPGAPPSDACGMMCARMLRYALEREGDIAAVIAEPIRSSPHVPPPGFWPEVRRACDEFGAVLIFDEIPTGLGKTGRLFTSEHQGVTPDITVLGKSLGGGMLPLAAVVADAGFDIAPELSLGHYTHEKNPLTTRAGLTTLQIIEDEGLVDHSRSLGDRTMARLAEMADRNPAIGRAEGAGLLIGVEILGEDGRRSKARADRAMWRAFSLGLNLKSKAGTLVLNPPLTIREAEMERALQIIEEAIA